MNATLSFDLSDPEQREEFEIVTKAQNMQRALEEVRSEIFRPFRKHGMADPRIAKLTERLDTLSNPEQLPDVDDATELVSLLEEKFGEIMREYGIDA